MATFKKEQRFRDEVLTPDTDHNLLLLLVLTTWWFITILRQQ